MAQFTGYICDRRECGITANGGEKGELPVGWLSLSLKTDADVQAHSWQLCSDQCAANLFVDRHEAKTTKRFKRTKPPTQGATDV